MADINDLVPVSRGEFANELAPCLALASGIGMSQADQRAWLSAAYRALDGIPIALLKRGCDAAMKTADHPSKIVPTIIKEIQESWDWRKKHARPAFAPRAEPEKVIPTAEQEKVKAMMADLAKSLSARNGETAR